MLADGSMCCLIVHSKSPLTEVEEGNSEKAGCTANAYVWCAGDVPPYNMKYSWHDLDEVKPLPPNILPSNPGHGRHASRRSILSGPLNGHVFRVPRQPGSSRGQRQPSAKAAAGECEPADFPQPGRGRFSDAPSAGTPPSPHPPRVQIFSVASHSYLVLCFNTFVCIHQV